ncbi:hypothetical protein LCGC14_3141100 [marine sediment metagenome]|uniref:Legume lectin domain-containing protein n=1 Tax=marine sediment metagenome TaxID=412755 RepID=A0A0F8VWW7_9ZZZZ
MPNVGSKGIVRYFETFATDTIASGTSTADGTAGNGVAWLCSLDTGDTAPVRAVNTSRGLHVTAATDTTDNDLVEFCGDTLMFTGQTGHSSMEILLQFDVVTTLAFNFGFNDDVLEGSTSLPVELLTTSFTSNSATFLGFVYDVDADNDELHVFWVNSNVDSTESIADLRMVGMAPTASKWLYLKCEMQDRGSGKGVRATFLAADHAGRSVEKVFDTSVSRTTPLCYYLGFENRDGIAHTAYWKANAWEQTIETV